MPALVVLHTLAWGIVPIDCICCHPKYHQLNSLQWLLSLCKYLSNQHLKGAFLLSQCTYSIKYANLENYTLKPVLVFPCYFSCFCIQRLIKYNNNCLPSGVMMSRSSVTDKHSFQRIVLLLFLALLYHRFHLPIIVFPLELMSISSDCLSVNVWSGIHSLARLTAVHWYCSSISK